MPATSPGWFPRIRRALRQRIRAWRALRAARDTSNARFASPPPVRRVLVVCYGNIYRSPLFAAVLAQDKAALEVRGGGFHPRAGRESPAPFVAMCSGRGISLAEHRSALVTSDDVRWADTIICMDRHNWSALDLVGADPAKIVWAGALTEGDVEIVDPYGRPEAEQERIVVRIEQSARRFVQLARSSTSGSR